MRRPSIKPLAERNRVAVGIVGTLILAGLVTAALLLVPVVLTTRAHAATYQNSRAFWTAAHATNASSSTSTPKVGASGDVQPGMIVGS